MKKLWKNEEGIKSPVQIPTGFAPVILDVFRALSPVIGLVFYSITCDYKNNITDENIIPPATVKFLYWCNIRDEPCLPWLIPAYLDTDGTSANQGLTLDLSFDNYD